MCILLRFLRGYRLQTSLFKCLLLLTFVSGSSHISAVTPGNAQTGTGKTGKDFFSLGVSLNEFRSVQLVLDENAGYDRDGDYFGSTRAVRFPLTAQTWGYMFSYGSYINDYFRAEVRAGKGFKDDSFEGALDVNLKYWLGGYLGFQHPITDYMSGYFLLGLTHYEADTTRRQIIIETRDSNGFPTSALVEPSPERMEEGLFDTRFSTSWMLGLEFSLIQDWFLTFEYGRLLKDTGSNIKVRQASAQIKYEF